MGFEKKLQENFVYVVLFLSSLVFIWQCIIEYCAGNTSLSVTRDHITLSDLPTLTICFNFPDVSDNAKNKIQYGEFEYGKDFFTEVRMFDDEKEAIVRLKENSFVESLFGAEIHFSKIWLTDMPREKKG